MRNFTTASKESTRKVAAALANRFPVIDPLPQGITTTISLIEEHHTYLRPMCDLLKRRVAFHNSTVPHAIRRSIEAAAKKGEFIAIAATTTLAEGVDLHVCALRFSSTGLHGRERSRGPSHRCYFAMWQGAVAASW